MENNDVSIEKSTKKKRKHGFLKFLLVVALIWVSIFGINKLTEQQMEKFMPDHPYVLNDADTRLSIRNDFVLPTVIDYEGEQKNISWYANSTYVELSEQDGLIDVSIKETTKPKKVLLTATYKMLLIGKAEKTYEVQILPSETIAQEDVCVVDIETVKDKTYDEDMTMVLREDGTVASMYGDFKQKVYHAEDALAVLNAYKSELGFANEVEFVENEAIVADVSTYVFDMSYNNIPIADSSVYMSVNEKFELNSIKCNFDKSIEKYKNISTISIEESTRVIEEALPNPGDKIFAFVASQRYEEIDSQMCLITEYLLVYPNNEIKTYEVNDTTGDFIGEVTHMSWATNSHEELNKLGATINDAISVSASGKGTLSDKTFTASKIGPLYLLHHPQKKITAHVDSFDIYASIYSAIQTEMLSSESKVLICIGFLPALYTQINETLQSPIVVDIDSYFNLPTTESAVDTYYHVNVAYDYFYKRFNRLSYNNKGTAIPLYTNFDNEAVGLTQYDNAAWNSLLKCIFVYPAKSYKYPLSIDGAVLGHEYTHAVFGSYANGAGEIKGLNEAYADTFAILMTHPDSWKFSNNPYEGKDVVIRDLANINAPNTSFMAIKGLPVPEKYHDSYWAAYEGEEHAISCMISNIFYKMYSSGHFSKYEFESILYKSLTYGYSGNDTYVTCRQQILQAMKELDCTPEERDFVRSLFDEKEIFDETDIYECEPEPTPEELAWEELLTALEGSRNDSERRFAVIISPIGFMLNVTPIYIYEEDNTPAAYEEKLINQYLNEYWASLNDTDLSDVLDGVVQKREGLPIQYKKVSSISMTAIEKIFGKTRSDMRNFIVDTIGSDSESAEESSIIQTILNLILTGDVQEMTKQEFLETMTE